MARHSTPSGREENVSASSPVMVTRWCCAAPSSALAWLNASARRSTPPRNGAASWTALTIRPHSARAALRCTPPMSHPMTMLMLSCAPSDYTETACVEGPMDIIPVLDLRGGIVVRARMGRRDLYRPIDSPLSPTSDPIDVMRGLRSIHPFKTFYVADLDAVMRTGDNAAAIRRLKGAFPAAALWVDNGVSDLSSARPWLDAGLGHLVIGSESQHDMALMRCLSQHDRVVLSLDFRDQAFLGPPALLDDVASWPRRLIVMTLARIGSGAGPDLDRLSAIREIAAGRDIYAAGGVRDGADLAVLKRAGISGALVATSLHDGRLTGSDVRMV